MAISRYIGKVNFNDEVLPFEHNGHNPHVWYMDKGACILWANTCTKKSSMSEEYLRILIHKRVWDYLDVDTFNKYFPLNKIIEISKPKITMASLLSVKKGSIYFNKTTSQVERVITIQDGSLVWSSRHKQEAKPYPKSAFRIANQVEVQNYLAEAQAASN